MTCQAEACKIMKCERASFCRRERIDIRGHYYGSMQEDPGAHGGAACDRPLSFREAVPVEEEDAVVEHDIARLPRLHKWQRRCFQSKLYIYVYISKAYWRAFVEI